MSTVSILRRLWRHKILVAISLIVAILAGTSVVYQLPGFKSRNYDVGIVTAHILVDTPSSQIVQVSPRGTATLGEQTLLLASLMVDGTIKSAIAEKAGLNASQLVGVNAAVTEPSAAGPSPVVPPSGRNAYVLTTQVMTDSAGDALPIIALQTQAPTSAAAERLTNATLAALGDYLSSRAALERVSTANRLQVGALGLSQATTETMGPSHSLAVIAGLLVFLMGCGLILGVPAFRRAWRAAAQREGDDTEGTQPEEIAGEAEASVRRPPSAAAVPGVDRAIFDFGLHFDQLGPDDEVEDDAASASARAT
ncbi:MAG: hypothetical protein WBQ18_13910 [Solirubrobacteraceae bacterium]